MNAFDPFYPEISESELFWCPHALLVGEDITARILAQSAFTEIQARMLLLRKTCGLMDEAELAHVRTKNPVMFNGHTWADLAQVRCAAVIIPLGGIAAQRDATAACLWVLYAPPEPHSKLSSSHSNLEERELTEWSNATARLYPGQWAIQVAMLNSADATTRIDGQSWRLGADLAAFLLAHDHKDAIARLAENWIVTGKLASDDAAAAVDWDNKPDLNVWGRRWLVPDGMDDPPGKPGFPRTKVGSLAEAYSAIVGHGIVPVEPKAWEQDTCALHALVGDSIKPLLMAALLAQPKTIVLWPLDGVFGNAVKRARAILEVLGFAADTIRDRPALRSAQLAGTAELLRVWTKVNDSIPGDPVYFNVNQGSLLARFAGLDAARSPKSRVVLCYRELGDEALDFHGVHFERGVLTHARLRATEPWPDETDWEFLRRRETAEERRLRPSDFAKLVRPQGEKKFLYVCAIRQIQRYILNSDGLPEMVGASALVESFGGVIDELAKELGAKAEELTSAAGIWRRTLPDRRSAERLALYVPVLAHAHAPGVVIDQAVVPIGGSLAGAVQLADAILRRHRAQHAVELPPAGPLIRREPRSGLPAVKVVWNPQTRQNEMVTAAGSRKTDQGAITHDDLVGKLFPGSKMRLPTKFDEIARRGGEYLGIVHIDTNRLDHTVSRFLEPVETMPVENGAKLRHSIVSPPVEADSESPTNVGVNLAPFMPVDAARLLYKRFSEGLDRAARTSVAEAYRRIWPKENNAPFRPLVCAGDDVTLVMGGADALEFTRYYLSEYERLTWSLLQRLGRADLGPITACAAIVFTPRTFPIAQSYARCVAWTKEAKHKVDRRASAVAFTRITASMVDVEGDPRADLRFGPKDNLRELTFSPYVLGRGAHAQPTLEQLEVVIAALRRLPCGTLREFMGEVTIDPKNADILFRQRVWDRWEKHRKDDAHSLRTAVSAITDPEGTIGNAGVWWWTEPNDPQTPRSTPLFDALELIAIEEKEEEETP